MRLMLLECFPLQCNGEQKDQMIKPEVELIDNFLVVWDSKTGSQLFKKKSQENGSVMLDMLLYSHFVYIIIISVDYLQSLCFVVAYSGCVGKACIII